MDARLEFPRARASSVRSSHASLPLTHRSIRSFKFTRSTLPSGSSWPSLPRVFSGHPLRLRSEEPGGPKPLEWLTS